MSAVACHKTIVTVKQGSPFCPNIEAAPDGKQVGFTLKETGEIEVINAEPSFNVPKVVGAGRVLNQILELGRPISVRIA
jgi:hypothetical protein